MTPTQAQDLRRLAEAAAQLDHNESEYWYNAGELMDPVGVWYPKNARFIAAMSPDVALQLLAERAILLEALKIAVRQNSHDMAMTGEELRKCEAAIAQCEGEHLDPNK